MGETQLTPAYEQDWLHQDLQREYYAILDVVSGFDQRLMTVKGWSVTLSLAALGLGFQQGHYALFALASITALGFWFIDVVTKRHQLRYYPRMRDIELAAFNLNHLELGELREVSAPRIDMYWSFKGFTKEQVNNTRAANAEEPTDWRTDTPWRRTPKEIHRLLRRAWMPHVLLPHAVAVVLGLLLFAGALADVNGLDQLQP